MMTASQMSAAIRAKKKAMEEEKSGAVKLSGIPEDATDIDILKQHEATDAMNENMPKDHDEEPELGAERAAEMHQDMPKLVAPDPKQINQPEDGEREMRNAKIRKMMARMMK